MGFSNSNPSIQKPTSLNKWPFFLIWLSCIIGVWSILPYIYHLGIASNSVSIANLFILTTAQTALVYGIVCWLSYKIVPKTDLMPFSEARPLKAFSFSGLTWGLLAGFSIVLLNKTLFKSSALSNVHPPTWTGFLGSLYGAINEEVLLRLFLFSLVYFLFQKTFRFKQPKRLAFLWTTNVLVAVIFGLGHMPAALKLITPSAFETTRILLLNGIPGIVFGWLYWSRGLWSAMTAHFFADIVIHVLVI